MWDSALTASLLASGNNVVILSEWPPGDESKDLHFPVIRQPLLS
jgi:hypothetical protein